MTQYGYDAASQLTSVTDALNQITRYAYDLSGNKVSQTDANNRVTTYVYDKLNRRTSRTLPLSQVETMNYDFVGNLTSKVDFNGKTTTYAYDSLNRLLSKTPDASFSGAAAIVMTYTSTGQRATMTDASGASSFTYDSRDRLKTKVTPQGTLTYTYDGASNVTRVVSSNANGTDVNYTFDANNRLATVVDNRTAGTTTYSYDATNQLSSFAYPNGVGHVHTYDNRDRLTNVAVNGPSGVLANYGQTFSPSSHKTAVNESSGRAVNYSYDSIYRLLNESITGNANSALNGALAYGLDPVGNRLSLTSTLAGIGAQTNTFDGNDRLVADTYDANGNTTASGGNTFAYEFEDRLTNYNAGAITYVYDGDGNRVARTEAGSTTRFLIDDLTPTGYAQVAEEVVAGFVVRQYTHGLMRVSQRQNISGTWTTSYYGYDGFGSTRQLLDGAGVVTDTFAFDGFGNLVARTGTTPNQYLYRGEALDAGTGMYYLRARWYRPGLGRFLTEDSFEGVTDQPESLNKYAFANVNPIDLMDPTGFSAVEKSVAFQTILRNSFFRLTNGRIRNITFDKVQNSSEIAFDAICCLDKAWSTLDIALQFQGAPSVMSAIDAICKLSCGATKQSFNPKRPGRFGGLGHRGKAIELITDLALDGFDIELETEIGQRFVDVHGSKGKTNSVYYQIGKRTKGGKPVCRERRALSDIVGGGGFPTFVGY